MFGCAALSWFTQGNRQNAFVLAVFGFITVYWLTTETNDG